MSLKFTDGWDHYPLYAIGQKWSFYGNPGGRNEDALITGRLGTGNALQLNREHNITLFKTFDNNGHAVNVVGFAFYMSAPLYDRDQTLLSLYDSVSGDSILELRIRVSTHVAYLLRGQNTQLGPNSSLAFQAGRWYYVEMKSVIDGSAGLAEMRIDGQTVITFTGNTKPGSATTANKLYLGNYNTGNFVERWWGVDDLYWLDGAGTTNTDYLGDVRILPLIPTAENGDSAFTLPGGGGLTLAQRILADAPTHFWDLQDAAGSTTFVDSGTSTTNLPAVLAGTYAGNATVGAVGPLGTDKSVDFTGGGGARIELPYNADWNFQGDWTLTFYVNWNDPFNPYANAYLADRGGSWSLYSRGDRNWRLNGGTGSSAFDMGNWDHGHWHQWHFVKAGTGLTIYQDGAYYWSSGFNNGGLDTGVMSFMADRNGGQAAVGRIAYIGVWNRGLTAAEVARQGGAARGNLLSKQAAVAVYDGDGSVIQASAVDNAETFDFSHVTANVQIAGVVTTIMARKDDAGLRAITGLTRVAGVDYESTAINQLSNSYSGFPYAFDKNPATGNPWTIAELNSSQFGIKVKV